HHAGERHRAYARDRHPHGDRCAHARHPAAVPGRGARRLGARRADRRRRRPRLWLHACAQGRAPRSSRCALGGLAMKKAFLIFTLITTGCATTSPVLEPQVTAAPGWNEASTAGAAAVSADWWHAFGSTELQGLVDAALAGSPDMAIAVERVRQAEAQVRVAGASLFPQLDVAASSSARASRDHGTSSKTEGSGATLSASYELDLWGRNAAGVRGAEAALRASAFDRDTARLTLIA